MKIKQQLFLTVALFIFGGAFASVNAQTPKAAAPYKITAIKLMPLNLADGAFQNEITTADERSFFNELSLRLLVMVEVTGEAGSFETGRMVEVVVTEGKKQIAKKSEQVGLIGEGGKFYIPVWLDRSLCDEVKVTARIVGQKTASTMTRNAAFMCGE